MTATSSDPGFEFKHRITGAVILIVFAVIVLPMILGGPDPQLSGSRSEPAQSTQETKVFVSKITPIGGASGRIEAERSVEPPAPDPVQSSGTAMPLSGKGQALRAEKPQGRDEGVNSAPAGPVTSNPGEELDRGWIVQVGVFRNKANAERLSVRLEKRGFRPSSGRVATKNGEATRVWIGPFAQRVEAARMRSRLQQATGQKGYIVAFP